MTLRWLINELKYYKDQLSDIDTDNFHSEEERERMRELFTQALVKLKSDTKTIEEIRKLKAEVEKKIGDAMLEYSEKTGLTIEEITFTTHYWDQKATPMFYIPSIKSKTDL